MISILVLTWGEYGWLVEPWKASWGRVWPKMPEVRVTDWPPDRMQHPSNFSRLLREELIEIECPTVLLSPVDTFPIPPVHSLNWLYNCASYIVKSANVVRFGFAWEPALAAHGEPAGPAGDLTGPTVYRCADWEHCSGSGGLLMDTALWNRAHLASLLQDGWAIDQVEAEGGEWMHKHRPDLVSVGLVPGLVTTVKLVDHHHPRTVSGLGDLDPRDAGAVRSAMPVSWKEGS